ncbi:HAD-IA family hydrolase [Ruminococcus sp. Marseille-P6503]|uniref:HAD family hydrolase n=1 Tax=Ruminococcus sp. Marseille-P6503 TaxID=2364796 RepID=UPI000F525F01|nr:HAD-IA family hydrolase [Ruminococcus sp. Marseille-P6503]
MKSLVIFDLDGTLINSIYDLADAVNGALADLGYPAHEVEKYYHFVGNGTVKLCERALPKDKRSGGEIMRLHSLFAERYEKCCIEKTKPYDGIVDVLQRLKAMGVKCAVASNKTDSFVKYIIRSLFGENTFDYIQGKTESVPAKPNPEMLNTVIRHFGLDKRECIMAGDSDVDVITAKRCGIESVGCAWGFRGAEELSASGADYIAYQPQDILKCIAAIPDNDRLPDVYASC